VGDCFSPSVSINLPTSVHVLNLVSIFTFSLLLVFFTINFKLINYVAYIRVIKHKSIHNHVVTEFGSHFSNPVYFLQHNMVKN
jgi:hypothetical protein